MRAAVAFQLLKNLNNSVVTTSDAAGVWGLSPPTASKVLSRLAADSLIQQLFRGNWLIDKTINPIALQAFVTGAYPSYVSLQSALFFHQMIEQIPAKIHLVSVAKTRTIKTSVATFMIHQVTTDFFCGFDNMPDGITQIATPEKALIDFFYFSSIRRNPFKFLPELELPKNFSVKHAEKYLTLIQSKSRQKMVHEKLREMLRRQ